jgi:thiamine biosynthesis lipoprotein ApbE
MTEPADATIPRFSHLAMGTVFDIFIAGEDPDYAAQAAQTAFREIDRLERQFSRFDPASEISRINRLKPGEEMTIGFETYECLALADAVRRETGGAFDINARAVRIAGPSGYPEGFLSPFKNQDGEIGSPEEPAENNNGDSTSRRETLSPKIARPIAIGFEIAEALRINFRERDPSPTVRDSSPDECPLNPARENKESDGFRFRRHAAETGAFRNLDLDLGAVGKGYALDKALDILHEWGIENALLHGGTSTAVAIGSPAKCQEEPAGWPVGVGAGWPGAPSRVLLSGRALSGSGTEVKGEHILDPRTGSPARRHLAAWASSPTAALSDALSTAFFVMSPEKIKDYATRHPDIWACVVVAYGDVRVFNPLLLP